MVDGVRADQRAPPAPAGRPGSGWLAAIRAHRPLRSVAGGHGGWWSHMVRLRSALSCTFWASWGALVRHKAGGSVQARANETPVSDTGLVWHSAGKRGVAVVLRDVGVTGATRSARRGPGGR